MSHLLNKLLWGRITEFRELLNRWTLTSVPVCLCVCRMLWTSSGVPYAPQTGFSKASTHGIRHLLLDLNYCGLFSLSHISYNLGGISLQQSHCFICVDHNLVIILNMRWNDAHILELLYHSQSLILNGSERIINNIEYKVRFTDLFLIINKMCYPMFTKTLQGLFDRNRSVLLLNNEHQGWKFWHHKMNPAGQKIKMWSLLAILH